MDTLSGNCSIRWRSLAAIAMGALALVLPEDRGAEAERLIGMISVADRPMRIFRDLGQATRWLDGQKPATEKSPPK